MHQPLYGAGRKESSGTGLQPIMNRQISRLETMAHKMAPRIFRHHRDVDKTWGMPWLRYPLAYVPYGLPVVRFLKT